MVEFCDGVLRENACRAVEQEVPLSFREVRERWTDTTERVPVVGVNSNQQSTGVQQQYNVRGTGRGGHQGNIGRGGALGGSGPNTGGMSSFRGGAAARGRGARFQQGPNSFAVCFNFNRGNCGRPQKGVGCDDGRGGEFAHVCNFFEAASNKYCLQGHPRVGNH